MARTTPMIRVFFFLSPFFFFFLDLSSSSLPLSPLALSPLPLAAGFWAVTPAVFGFLDGLEAMPSSTSSSSSRSRAGSRTTKRYLHLGHSIFLPIWLASRMVTGASQLGQSCL